MRYFQDPTLQRVSVTTR